MHATPSETPPDRNACVEFDTQDPLAHFREQFDLPSGLIYFNGNSLGPLPKAAVKRAEAVINKEWKEGLTASWNSASWFQLPVQLGDKLAALIGAEAGEVVMTDGVTINLYKLLHLALQLRSDRHIILMDESSFPTDSYAAQGLTQKSDHSWRVEFRHSDDILKRLAPDIAVVCLSDIHYKSGRITDMAAVTKASHDVGALTLWDLCHSAGIYPVDLNRCDADFATGCTYKYLNGGPGSPAFAFVAKRHQNRARQPLWGWWGHRTPFALDNIYRPAEGVQQLLVGTQPILSMAVAEAGIDLALAADPCLVRQKSQKLGDIFIALVETFCSNSGIKLACPRSATERGSQVAFHHNHGYEVIRALADRGVIGDFRAPDVLRFGLAPLFVRYVDIWDAVQHLVEVFDRGLWQKTEYRQRATVT